MLTPINQIAAAIEVAFFDLGDFPGVPAAREALEPLHYVQTVDDFYGIDKADAVVTAFLKAAEPGRGPWLHT